MTLLWNSISCQMYSNKIWDMPCMLAGTLNMILPHIWCFIPEMKVSDRCHQMLARGERCSIPAHMSRQHARSLTWGYQQQAIWKGPALPSSNSGSQLLQYSLPKHFSFGKTSPGIGTLPVGSFLFKSCWSLTLFQVYSWLGVSYLLILLYFLAICNTTGIESQKLV